MKNATKLFTKVLFFTGLFLLALTVGYFLTIYNKIVVTSPKIITLTPSPTPTPDPMRIRNILLLGYAGGDHDGATLTDTIILARIYPNENKIKLISIPRDIWVPIPISKDIKQNFKINHAFAIGLDDKKYPDKADEYKGLSGAGALAKMEVEKITGLTPENFVAVNFSGFQSVVDNIGGVNVNVPFTFEDKYYPIKGLENESCGKDDTEVKVLTATLSGQLLEEQFTCRYETIRFVKGPTSMNGETALKFVRSRHSDVNGSDFGRSLRQQAFLIGIKDKLLKLGSIPKIVTLINTVSKNVITDIDFKKGLELLSEQENLKDFKIETLSLTTDNVLSESTSSDRQYILIPKAGDGNWEEVHKFIQDNI